jgi:glycosyltransferase involved in cell wall biosynthesis
LELRHLSPTLSFIVPAHNEELLIGATLASIHAAAREAAIDYELIVVDDASTDATARIAAEHSARVLHVNNRQISATRNCGAREARGQIFIFVDADTLATADAVRDVLATIQAGAVGGGCLFRFDGNLPRWARLTYPIGIRLFRLLNVVGGCFIFCTRQAFETTGGFSNNHFAAEELIFTKALKRIGKFVIPRAFVVTSGRKLRSYSGFEILWTLVKISCGGPRSYRAREGLEVWYGERRADPETGARL